MVDLLVIDDFCFKVFFEFYWVCCGFYNCQLWYVDYVFGCWDFQKGGLNCCVCLIVYYNDDGEFDGVVFYQIDKDFGLQIIIFDMVVIILDVEVVLWEFFVLVDFIEMIKVLKVDFVILLLWVVEDF